MCTSFGIANPVEPNLPISDPNTTFVENDVSGVEK
jgi:hypothetical protein